MKLPEVPVPSHLIPYAQQVEGLRRIGRIFWKRGWSLGTSSNYSVVVGRDPLLLLVTASGKDKSQLLGDDFVLVGASGEPTLQGQPKSSAETLLHCIAAKHFGDVGCVLHTHSVWSTILSQRFAQHGGILFEGYEMLKGLSGVKSHEHREWLPIFENTQDIPSLAEIVSAAHAAPESRMVHGYLIKGHGIYTWGKDIEEAYRHIEIWEFLLECLGRQCRFT